VRVELEQDAANGLQERRVQALRQELPDRIQDLAGVRRGDAHGRPNRAPPRTGLPRRGGGRGQKPAPGGSGAAGRVGPRAQIRRLAPCGELRDGGSEPLRGVLAVVRAQGVVEDSEDAAGQRLRFDGIEVQPVGERVDDLHVIQPRRSGGGRPAGPRDRLELGLDGAFRAGLGRDGRGNPCTEVGERAFGTGMPTARAHANIALVKYWGKRDGARNRPAAGSLSVTLAGLDTETRVELCPEAVDDRFVLDGVPQTGRPLERVRAGVDRIRAATGRQERVEVVSENTFPTAAGLASSASAFAALTVATAEAFGHHPGPRGLSILARQGSGSAARSIFGGFVEMVADVEEPYAEPIREAKLELGAVVCVVASASKDVGSTDGMEHTRRTSPYHAAWLEQVARDLYEARHALAEGDFDRLAAVSEGNCLAMHADALAARPGLVYFAPATLALISTVEALRRDGLPVFFTVDAGPHVVVFAPRTDLDAVARRLAGHPGVETTRVCGPGEGARVT